MKIDRLLGIIIYLFNHDQVPASFLAERFQVSVRTIQRDIISISAIGIPVYSLGGKYGGYSILPTYKIKNSEIRGDEQQLIVKALESLATSYTSDTLNGLIEKYDAIIEKEGGRRVFWDFSVTKENKRVQETNGMLERAISGRNYISFEYQNAKGVRSEQTVEPLAIHYKWYAWYLFAYSEAKKDYRTFKTARINGLRLDGRTSAVSHGDIEKLMKESERAYYETCIPIEIHFAPEESGLIGEYFPDCVIEILSNTESRIFLHVPAKERLWKALLLSFGDRVYVAGPESYRKELVETAEKFIDGHRGCK